MGIAGCYHETAHRRYFNDRRIGILPCLSFDELPARWRRTPPLLQHRGHQREITIGGSLLPTTNCCSRAAHGSSANKTHSKVRAGRIARTDARPDRRGPLHPIALMQCGDFLKSPSCDDEDVELPLPAGSAWRSPRPPAPGCHLRRRRSGTLRTRNPQPRHRDQQHNFTRFLLLRT